MVPSIRLYPNRPDVRWTRKVYERLIIPPLESAEGRLKALKMDIAHHGFSDIATVAEKLERNIRLVALELETDPNDYVALYNLAATHNAAGVLFSNRDQFSIAQRYLARSIEKMIKSGGLDDESVPAGETYGLLANTLRAQLAFADSIAALSRARTIDPQNLGLLCNEASRLLDCGMSAEAQKCWELLPRIRQYEGSAAMRVGQFVRLVGAKTEFAYFLEESKEYYQAAAIWAELAVNRVAMFDAIPGLRRTLRLIVFDILQRPTRFARKVGQLARRDCPSRNPGTSYTIING